MSVDSCDQINNDSAEGYVMQEARLRLQHNRWNHVQEYGVDNPSAGDSSITQARVTQELINKANNLGFGGNANLDSYS